MRLQIIHVAARPLVAAFLVAHFLAFPLAVQAQSRGHQLELRLDGELGRPDRQATSAGQSTPILPVLLGITSLGNRVERTRIEVDAWDKANLALESHLEERKKHLLDLRDFVQYQDGAIDVLQSQTQMMEKLAGQPRATAVAAPQLIGSAPVEMPSASFYGLPVGSPYLDGGMLVIIVALLGWALFLKSRARDQEQSVRRAVSVAYPSPSAELEDATEPPPSPERPESDKDVLSLFRQYDRAAAALVTSIGAGAVADEHRDRLKRVLSAVSKKDEFLAEAEALAAEAGDDESRRWLEQMRTDSTGAAPTPEQSTLIMSAERMDEIAPSDKSSLNFTKPPTKRASNSRALKEVDTLIAFENYDQASTLLNKLLDDAPDNPEYRLRLLHILSAAGETEATAEQEEILAAMMDGPLSETLHRVRSIGKDLLPGHPLFQDVRQGAQNADDTSSEVVPGIDVRSSEDGSKAEASGTTDLDPSLSGEPEPSSAQPLDEGLDDFMNAAFNAQSSAADHALFEASELSLDLELNEGGTLPAGDEISEDSGEEHVFELFQDDDAANEASVAVGESESPVDEPLELSLEEDAQAPAPDSGGDEIEFALDMDEEFDTAEVETAMSLYFSEDLEEADASVDTVPADTLRASRTIEDADATVDTVTADTLGASKTSEKPDDDYGATVFQLRELEAKPKAKGKPEQHPDS